MVLLLVLAGPATARLDIQITEGVDGEMPIALVPFKWNGAGDPPKTDVSAIIRANLYRTGLFKFAAEKDFIERPHHGGEVNFKNWQVLGVESLVVGTITPNASGGYEIRFQLFDIYKQGKGGAQPYKIKQLAGHRLTVDAGSLRLVAHKISNIIYEKLTGKPGAFDVRVAYVTKLTVEGQQRYAIRVADADGHAPFTLKSSAQPLMSPAWSPDGRYLAYVSYESGRPAIYVQELATAKRELVSARAGLNSAPAWSPDGRQLAMSLSYQGNAEIYVMDMATKKLRRLTNNSAIDTEPAWSPDGRSLVFTSDRSGRPQVYQVAVSGGYARRVTFEGKYNARASFSRDGKSLLMVHHDGQGFRIAVMDLDTRTFKVLTGGRLDESPAWAPNDSIILYAAEHGGRGVLYAVSANGKVRQRLLLQLGDVREPVWEPLKNR